MSLFNQSKNENGYTLVIALLLIIIITTISFSLIITTSNTLGVTKNEREDQSIFYIAESGANIQKIKIEDAVYKAYIAVRDEHKATDPIQLPNKNFIDVYKEKIQTYLPQTKSIYTNFEKQLTKDPEACVDVSTAFKEDKLHITIQSAGYLKDDGSTINCENGQIPNNHRVVEKDVTVNLDLKFLTEIEGGGGGETEGEYPPISPELPTLTVWTKGDIELSGSGGIIGDVLTTNGNIKIEGNGKIDGNAHILGDLTLTGSSKVTGEAFIKGKYIPGDSTSVGRLQQCNDLSKENCSLLDNVVDMPEPLPIPSFPDNKIENLKSIGLPKDFPMTGNNYVMGWSHPENRNHLTLTKDAQLNNFTMTGSRLLTINANLSEINLLINGDLELGGSSKLYFKGNSIVNLYVIGSLTVGGSGQITSDGSLNIFVKNQLTLNQSTSFKVKESFTLYSQNGMTLGGDIYNQDKNPAIGNIYYSGNTPPQINGSNQTITASLYLENADFELSGSKQITGNIIVANGKKVTLGGGGPPTGHYLLAPNAHVTLNNHYKGVIIAKSFSSPDYAIVTYGTGSLPPPIIIDPTTEFDYSDPSRDSLLDDIITKEIDK